MVDEILEQVMKQCECEMERVQELANISGVNKGFNELVIRRLFKKVYLRPCDSFTERNLGYPCVLSDTRALAVKTLICKADKWEEDCYVSLMVEAVQKFKNLRYLATERGEYNASKLPLIFQRLGVLVEPPFPVLEYIEVNGISPDILCSQGGTVVHLSLRDLPGYTTPALTQDLSRPFPNLEFVTLDSSSLMGLWQTYNGPMFYDAVKNVRIVWEYKDLIHVCTHFQTVPAKRC